MAMVLLSPALVVVVVVSGAGTDRLELGGDVMPGGGGRRPVSAHGKGTHRSGYAWRRWAQACMWAQTAKIQTAEFRVRDVYKGP